MHHDVTINADVSNPAIAAGRELLSQEVLHQAFERFNEASRKLEDRYQLLCQEAEQLRARLRDKDAEIARQARLAMLGETAGAIAHEVRNPLGSIKLFASLLRRDLEGRPKQLELVEGINCALVAIDNVVSNILQFARPQQASLAPVNIHSIIQEQIQTLLAGSNGLLSMSLRLQAPPFVRGNEQALRQVFYNVVLNALQAMRYKGQLTVQTWNDGSGTFCALIRDTGPGIPPEVLARLFEPFVTSKKEGTGLGLAIVKKILAQHQGSIEATNDGGAVFVVRLPQLSSEEV